MLDGKLEIGEKYEFIFKDKNKGAVIYLGKLQKNNVEHKNVVAGRINGWVRCWRFIDYDVKDGNIIVERGIPYSLSKSQEEFLDERLKRSNL